MYNITAKKNPYKRILIRIRMVKLFKKLLFIAYRKKEVN